MNPNDDPNNQPIDPNASQDDLFPGFLNGQPDPSVDQVPDFLTEDQNKSQPTYISAGSPEAPISIAVDAQPASPEKGTEVQESQESAQEDREQVENKEIKKIQQDKQDTARKPFERPVEDETQDNAPKLYGVIVPPKIVKNFNLIRSRKLKGSPTASKTWLYVLLDRILKMHNQKG